MGDVFRGKLHKTTQHLKEALELDELDEAVKWEVKVTGLPVFYSDGKSKGAVRVMLRKLLKHPDDIISITRTTSAELKKIRRGQIAGDEPGDEDEDKSPVGPSYNEEVDETLDLKKIRAQRKVKAAGRMKDVKKVFSKKTKPTKDLKVPPRHDDPDRGYFEANLPPHLAKFVDKKGDLKPDAAKRVAAGRKKDKPKYRIVDKRLLKGMDLMKKMRWLLCL